MPKKDAIRQNMARQIYEQANAHVYHVGGGAAPSGADRVSQNCIFAPVSFSDTSHSWRARVESAAASFGLTAFMLSK